MRLRFTSVLGTPVVEDGGHEPVGSVDGALFNPDTGVLEGVFVKLPGMFSSQTLFLPQMDILHWGARVTIRDRDVLCEPGDIIRLVPLLESGRTIVGQPIFTESGRSLGRCVDVQFSTKSFRLEWLFPKKLFRAAVPLPASQIIEVRKDAIVVKETAATQAEEDGEPEVPILPQIEAA